jgi:hypothetical protein
MFITSPDRFAEWFKYEVPGAYREITAQDIRVMNGCGLIGRYGFYGRQDLETIRGILQYEQMRAKIIEKTETKSIDAVRCCKNCGQPLSDIQPIKKGRHKEYCPLCESSRSKERYRKWRRERQVYLQ